MNLNERLNTYINEKGIKQVYIAQKTGLTADTVSRILSNNRRMLADEFLSICAALEIDPNIFRPKSA